MAARESKIPFFSQAVELVQIEKTLKAGDNDAPLGTIIGVLTATPTVAERIGDDANVAWASIVIREASAGNPILLAHPLDGKEYGPYVYGPGSATDAMIGDAVTVVDNQTVSTAGVTTNDIPLGHISRIYDVDNVYIRLMAK